MEPFRINVERARRESKSLLAAARAGDPVSLAKFRRGGPPRLADAQHVVASGHGFRNWPDFVRAMEQPGAALRRAARAGDAELLYALLEAGAPPNDRDPRTGRTALLAAAAADQLDAVDVLVGWVHTDIHAMDTKGRTALDLARSESPVAAVLSSCGLGPARPPLTSTHAELEFALNIAFLDHVSRVDGVAREEVGNGFVFRTGLVDNSRNGVVCDSIPGDVAGALGSAVERFADVPAIWWVGSSPGAESLRAQLAAFGCRAERSAVHMAASVQDLDGEFDSGVQEVTNPDQLVGVDADEARLLCRLGAPVRHFAVDGTASLSLFARESAVLGLHLHVVKGHRRRGLGRVLTRHAIAVAAREGYAHIVFGPTPATIPFYERLGFTLEASLPDAWFYLPMQRMRGS